MSRSDTAQFTLQVTAHIASAGPGLLWKVALPLPSLLPLFLLLPLHSVPSSLPSPKVYSGVKKSTRQAASVFVLERTLLDRSGRRSRRNSPRGAVSRFEKADRELVWEMMKRGVGQLTRLRHPQVLTLDWNCLLLGLDTGQMSNALHCTVLPRHVQIYIALHCTNLAWTAVYCTALYCTTRICVDVFCTALDHPDM